MARNENGHRVAAYGIARGAAGVPVPRFAGDVLVANRLPVIQGLNYRPHLQVENRTLDIQREGKLSTRPQKVLL